jgi:hypothetical protein
VAFGVQAAIEVPKLATFTLISYFTVPDELIDAITPPLAPNFSLRSNLAETVLIVCPSLKLGLGIALFERRRC